MKISDVLLRLVGGRTPGCPNEADILAYSESRLPAHRSVQCEQHFAGCDDCRQVLAFLGRSEEAAAPLTEEAVSAQTERVLAYIQRDERNRRKPAQKARAAGGFYVSYPRLASVGLVTCAIAAASLFLITRGQAPGQAGMEALRLANKDVRYIEARVSGGFNHSRYAGVTRGGDRHDDELQFNLALIKLKSAMDVTAPVDDRHVLARVYLARGTRADARQALEILNQLAARGVETPEALSDTGVALLQLDRYSDAIEYFSKALAKSPPYGEALFNRALAEERANRNDDARRDWKQFISQASNDNWKTEAIGRLKQLEN
ncbi:MAG: tetratricopeptide repeat protein [Acidobacteriota bacterium]